MVMLPWLKFCMWRVVFSQEKTIRNGSGIRNRNHLRLTHAWAVQINRTNEGSNAKDK
jgi:hypothetical protein